MKLYFGGGLNEQQQPGIDEAFTGSFNFDLRKDRNALIPRSPFDLKGTATNGGDIRGLMQLVKRDDTQTTLVQAGTAIYRWDGASAFTSMGTASSASSQLRDTYWSLGDYLVVTDLQKLTVVSKWNGSTFSTLTTGLGSDLYAKYGIVHNGRVWLFNVKTSSDTPHLMVASAFEDPTSYDTTQRAITGTFTTGLEAFYILSPDLRPINGVAKTISGDLIISTVGGALFRLVGTSATTYKFVDFYPASNAVGTEAMVSMGNDVIYMRQGGNIDALQATQNYGDVAADDLSRWINSTVSGLTEAIAVYDQVNQKVLFFVTGKVLVLFKDILFGGALMGEKGERAKASPWSVYKTLDAGAFNTAAAKYMRRPGTTSYSVYFGSSDGRIFDLNGSGSNGDAGSAAIQVVRKSRLITEADSINFMRHITRGNIQYQRTNEVSFNIELDWADEYTTSAASLILKGSPVANTGAYYGGAFYYGALSFYSQGFSFLDKISHQNFSVVGRGPGCYVTCSSLSPKSYQVDRLELL